MKKMQDTASPGHFVCRRMLILKTFLVILLWSTCLVSGYRGHAQERTTVTVNMTDVTLNEVITELKKQTKYDFFYNSELVKSKGRVSVRARNLDLREVLEQVLTPVGLEYAIQQDLITIRERRVQQEVAKIEMITVSGKVTDKDGNPVVGATVVIHGTTQGVATDVDGKYSLMTRPDDVLTISFIGYKTIEKPFTLSKQIPGVNFRNLLLQEDSQLLGEVKVTGQRSQMKFDIDKKVFNVDQNISSTGGTASDVLTNIPSVEVDNEGEVSLRGSSDVTVWINGRASGLSADNRAQILEQLPAESIERIEVITNPSAKFSPEGTSGIINIVLKEDRRAGYYGSLQAGVDTRGGWNASGNVNYSSNKTEMYAGVGYRERKRDGGGFSNRTNTDASGNPVSFLNQTSDNDGHGGQTFVRA